MKINFKMLGFFMEDWIVTKFYTALIVTIEVSGFVIQDSKLFE